MQEFAVSTDFLKFSGLLGPAQRSAGSLPETTQSATYRGCHSTCSLVLPVTGPYWSPQGCFLSGLDPAKPLVVASRKLSTFLLRSAASREFTNIKFTYIDGAQCLKKVNSLEFQKSTPWRAENLEDIPMVGPASMSLNRVVVTSIKTAS